MVWNGLDTGGVELLWEDERLLTVLEVMSRHQPFAYGDIKSPIYDELCEIDESVTWFNPEEIGGARTIFRRSNPLMKLGLISGNSQSASITQTGIDLIQKDLTMAALYRAVTRGFIDIDGTRSFAYMAKAALLFPTHQFTLEDVEFAVATSDGTKVTIEQRLKQIKKEVMRFAPTSRRPRILRRFMRTLVSAGVLFETGLGWQLSDPTAAAYVVGIDNGSENLSNIEIDSLAQIVSSQPRQNFNVSEILEGKRSIPSFGVDAFTKMDNSLRALLLERAHSEHERLVEVSANDIRAVGGTPIEGVSSFDVGCYDKFKLLIEAKYINNRNATSQFRKATAQLPEYRWRHQDDLGLNVKQIIAVNENPEPLVGSDYMSFIREDRNLEIIWQSAFGLVNPDGQNLKEILNQIQ